LDPRSPSSIKASQGRRERALLIGLYSGKREKEEQRWSLEELARLANTAGAEVCVRELHEIKHPVPATYIGKGLAENLAEKVKESSVTLVIFDENLSPTQNRNLEKILSGDAKVRVIDRTALILDIFASRARTREGRLQVELAQLRYLLPRLAGHGAEFSQLAGGIGTRGPGETRLEMDRRKAKDRVARVKKELGGVRSHRELHRQKRKDAPIPTVALVGYTNAGKSTLMNRLTDAGVLMEDKLFATLDPTVRRLRLPSGRDVLLSDTVGFVNKLPHTLVEAFKATFEEVAAADLLIHVIDVSYPRFEHQAEVVEDVLTELELSKNPSLRVYNKSDALTDETQEIFREKLKKIPKLNDSQPLLISALKGKGLEDFLNAVEDRLSERFRLIHLKIPHGSGSDLSLLYRNGRVLSRKDKADGVILEAEVDEKLYNLLSRYRT
jgi:GTP-binding protein HflX